MNFFRYSEVIIFMSDKSRFNISVTNFWLPSEILSWDRVTYWSYVNRGFGSFSNNLPWTIAKKEGI